MSWISEPKRSWAEWIAINILKVGPMPEHVAFIMDGNRRYAKKNQMETQKGHADGFKKLTEVLSWCKNFEISQVTVYAFSIENFKRSRGEVDGLMDLAEEKFAQILEEKDNLSKHGIRINVIGQISLLSKKLQKLISEVIWTTKDNSKCCLNLAMAYTSRQEITNALEEISTGISENLIQSSDVNESLLDQCLYTSDIKNPDLLIRTSGETRLSDFLLWQSSFTHLYFTKVLWPEFNMWNFFGALFHYQRHHHTLKHMQQIEYLRIERNSEKLENSYLNCENPRTQDFICNLKNKRNRKLSEVNDHHSSNCYNVGTSRI